MSLKDHPLLVAMEHEKAAQVSAAIQGVLGDLLPALAEKAARFKPTYDAFRRGEPADYGAMMDMLRDAEAMAERLAADGVAKVFPLVKQSLPVNQWGTFRATMLHALVAATRAHCAKAFGDTTAASVAVALAKDAAIATDADDLLADIFQETAA